ncbi:MAG TPA: hypothetical protein VFF26_06860 [Gallionella sp.]|nr:hypothetical protein [Gallionella sp.]
MMTSMREQMPKCAAWVDALRDAFGREFIDDRIRVGLKDGTCWFAEAGHYIGQPGQPERDAEREADEFRVTLDQIATALPPVGGRSGQGRA